MRCSKLNRTSPAVAKRIHENFESTASSFDSRVSLHVQVKIVLEKIFGGPYTLPRHSSTSKCGQFRLINAFRLDELDPTTEPGGNWSMLVYSDPAFIITASEVSARSGMDTSLQFGGKVVGISLRQWTSICILPAANSSSRPFVHRLLPISEPPVFLERRRNGVVLSASPTTDFVATSNDGALGMALLKVATISWAWINASPDLRQPIIILGKADVSCLAAIMYDYDWLVYLVTFVGRPQMKSRCLFGFAPQSDGVTCKQCRPSRDQRK